MRDFSLPRSYRLVTVPFLTFMHLLTVEEQLACLACAHRHLEPGGRLALDVFNPDLRALTDSRMGQEGPEEPPFVLDDGRSVTRRFRDASVDLHRQVLDCEIIYAVTHPDGRRERLVHAFPYRYFFRYELEHLLARAGFTVEAVYGDFDGSPVGATYPGELIVVARKP